MIIIEKYILTAKNPDISVDDLLARLQLDKPGKRQSLIDNVTVMCQEAVKIAKPVALYAPFSPTVRDGDLWLDEWKVESDFVYEKLSSCETVIPYVASCGLEVEEWSRSYVDNVFKKMVADIIKEMCYGVVRGKLFDETGKKYFKADKSISTLNPGSLEQWPITAQKGLFEILGGVTDDIGVILMDSMLMTPVKSTSGIIFQTDEPYHNCQLCSRVDCPGRKVPYKGLKN